MGRFIKIEHMIIAVDKIQYIYLNSEVLSIVCLHDTKNIRFSRSEMAERHFEYLTGVLIDKKESDNE